jgi:hypothetical protein
MDPAPLPSAMPAPISNLDLVHPQRSHRERRVSGGRTLHHYTLNTGATKHLHRHPLTRRTTATLTDLVQRGGGPFAGVLSAFSCRVEPELEEGVRTFWFLRSDQPVLLCVACWLPKTAETAFGIAERAYYDLLLESCSGSPSAANVTTDCAPDMPLRLPWLSQVILPGANHLQSRESIVLDELERCLVWTILKRSTATR